MQSADFDDETESQPIRNTPWRRVAPTEQQSAVDRSLTQFSEQFGIRHAASEFLSQIILGPSLSWAFISTGKNASTSTLRFLFEVEFGVPLTVRFDHLHDINPDAVVHQLAAHGVFQRALALGLDARQVQQDPYVLRACIVRHPLDRAISGFRYFCRSNELGKSWFIADRLRANAFGFDWDTMPHTARGFEMFLRYIQNEQARVGVSWLDAHWRPQADFIKPAVFEPQLIGRMEHLDDFFVELADRLNTTVRPPAARANAQPSVTRAEFASDEAVRRLVRSIYASDYEAFGYDEWDPVV